MSDEDSMPSKRMVPSYCCQRCGALIGWVGRAIDAVTRPFGFVLHDCRDLSIRMARFAPAQQLSDAGEDLVRLAAAKDAEIAHLRKLLRAARGFVDPLGGADQRALRGRIDAALDVGAAAARLLQTEPVACPKCGVKWGLIGHCAAQDCPSTAARLARFRAALDAEAAAEKGT